MLYLYILKKRILLYVLLICCLYVSSCKNYHSFVTSDKEFEPVTILFDSGSNSYQKELFEKLVDDFNNTNKYNIFVKLLNDSNKTENKNINSDCALVNSSKARKLFKTKKIVDLSSIIKDPKWGLPNRKDFFCKAVYKQIKYGFVKKKITSAPLFIDAHFILYNKDLLNKIGYERLPRSWFRFQLLLKKAGKKMNKVFGFEYNFENFIRIIQARGGSVLQPAELNYSFNNPVVINTIRYLKKLEKKSIISLNELYSNQTEFAFGNLLMVFSDISSIDFYANLIQTVNNDMNWDIELLVTRKPGNNIVLSCNNNAVIMQGTKVKEFSSWLFIKWLLKPEQQKKIVKETKALPASLSLIPEIKNNNENNFSKQWLKAIKLAYYSKKEKMPTTYDFENASILFKKTLKNITSGKNIFAELFKLEYILRKERRKDKMFRKSFES